MFKILILITIFSKIYCKDTSPVFIIDHLNVIGDDLASNPLTAMTEGNFHKLLSKTRKNSEFIIIFVEEKFCQEDITIKDVIGTPFHHLRQGIIENKAKYIPAVHKPFKVLEKLFHPLSSNSYYVTSLNSKPDITIKNNKAAYIFFTDGKGESRANVLRKHDVLMREIYFSVSSSIEKPVVAFYTGKQNPIVLDKIQYKIRRFESMGDQFIVDPAITVRSKRALFRFKGMAKSIGGRRTWLNELPMFIGETHTKNSIKTKLSYPEFDLHFDIDYDKRYWTLRRVCCLVDNIPVGYRTIDMSINWGKSYVCGDPITIRYRRGGDTITIPHMQVQPFQEDTGGDGGGGGGNPAADVTVAPTTDRPANFSFGEVEECTGYFSQHILACLFVVCILLFVLYNGVQMLLAVETNDRYDDFKKPHYFGGQRAE